jgi:DNA-binding CsgD family transcriptional regulator/tetratricopeptide (TPR) repeat protein
MNQGRVQGPRLLGRQSECEALDRLLTDALAGRSGVTVLRGGAGVGKSALLSYLLEQVAGWHLAQAVGVESEMELPYSGLHQLCGPMLDHLDRLPVPQREALATVFGLRTGPAPDRFLVGLGALTLFAEVAEEQPLVCVIDDAQWLDRVSAQILGFVARRLLAERIAVVCAARTGIGDEVLAGLPDLPVHGLHDPDARALLLENVYGPIDAAVVERIVMESHGNPLALLELPRAWSSPAELAGGYGFPDSQSVVSKIEWGYLYRLRQFPVDTQLLVLAAGAEPLGYPVLLQAAAENLGIDMAAVDPAVDAGLLRVGNRIEFAHPLVRSAAYRGAGAEDRYRVHRALADATEAEADPDRRAWHLARATPGPDEAVAVELERSAGRAQARGGMAAAAAFLQRAVELTEDPARRAERALGAAEASLQAGAFDAAQRLLDTAESYQLDGFQSARTAFIRGQLAVVSAYGNTAAPLLLEAARRLGPFDLELARRAYLTAWGAAITANHLGGAGILPEICRAARALPPLPAAPHPLDLVLDGFALLTTDGRARATPVLQRAAKAVSQLSAEDLLRWGWLAPGASSATWDPDGAVAIHERKVQLVRDAGALGELPIQLHSLALERAWLGDFASAGLLTAESDSVAAATGSQVPPFAVLRLQALQGREAEASPLIEAVIQQGTAGGQGIAVMSAYWAASVLYNGLARYEEAASAAREVMLNAIDPWESMWALIELIEAATRIGSRQLAHRALDRLADTTQPAGTDFGLGIEARSRALLSDDAIAEELFRESIDRLGRTQVRPELARAHLLYGEWLRREGRRVDAREQLRTAYEMFVAIGMEAFAERTRRELLATGEKVRKRRPETRDQLTSQEEQIARLARDGFSNPEIGAQLFLSARTVEWHLGKVFTKFGISSRRELRAALDEDGRHLAYV